MITNDGYATVPWGKRFMLIHNGFQISDHKTDAEAIAALKKHRNQTIKPGTKSNNKLPLKE
jgi:hypothetical protein